MGVVLALLNSDRESSLNLCDIQQRGQKATFQEWDNYRHLETDFDNKFGMDGTD